MSEALVKFNWKYVPSSWLSRVSQTSESRHRGRASQRIELNFVVIGSRVNKQAL